MANHTVTFPITDPQEILKLQAGDEVTVQGHIIGIRDRTQIRIFDQGVVAGIAAAARGLATPALLVVGDVVEVAGLLAARPAVPVAV